MYKNVIAYQYYIVSHFDIFQFHGKLFLSQITYTCILNKFEHFFSQMSRFIETLHVLVKLSLVCDMSSSVSWFVISSDFSHIDFCKVGIFFIFIF